MQVIGDGCVDQKFEGGEKKGWKS